MGPIRGAGIRHCLVDVHMLCQKLFFPVGAVEQAMKTASSPGRKEFSCFLSRKHEPHVCDAEGSGDAFCAPQNASCVAKCGAAFSCPSPPFSVAVRSIGGESECVCRKSHPEPLPANVGANMSTRVTPEKLTFLRIPGHHVLRRQAFSSVSWPATGGYGGKPAQRSGKVAGEFAD